MEVLEELCYELEDMLEPIVKKGDISPTELDNVKDAVKSIYYIETIKAMKDYSNDYSGNSYRGSYDDMSYRGSYDDYGRRSMDRYSGRRGRDARGRYTSRDNYSRHDEKEQMIERLERKLDMAKSEAERQAINDMIRELER